MLNKIWVITFDSHWIHHPEECTVLFNSCNSLIWCILVIYDSIQINQFNNLGSSLTNSRLSTIITTCNFMNIHIKGWMEIVVTIIVWQVYFDKFDKFIFIISKRSQTHEENTCRILLYTLSLKKKLHTCIIPCNTTLVWHIDKISTKNTHIIMDTFIILLF